MLVSVVAMALLLTFWMADGLTNRSLGAAEEVCSGSCEVEGQADGCEGMGDYCISYSCCKSEDMPCSADEVTHEIHCTADEI